MIFPRPIELYHVPSSQNVKAHIVRLSNKLIVQRMGRAWWNDPTLAGSAENEIDRNWDWTQLAIEYDGRTIPSAKYGVSTGDGAIQGAIMLSREPVFCEGHDAGEPALFVELLFVAPRNRHWIRRDGIEQFRGVGVQLLRTAAQLSEEAGYTGRLKLESSPGFIEWYKKRGLLELNIEPILHQGVEYTPMELSADRVAILLPRP